MPEALVIVAVFVVALVAFVGAWIQSRNPAGVDVMSESARLKHHAAWLSQRLQRAQREKWEAEMVNNLEAELEVTSRALGRIEMP